MRITHPKLTAARDSIHKFCCEYATNPTKGRTIVIYGENGSGKTRLLRQVEKWAMLTAQWMPMVLRKDLGDQVGLSWVKSAHWPLVIDEFQKHREIAITDELMMASMTILDDIGAEHDPSGFGREQLYLILSRREFRWNMFSTNFPPSEWDRKFERRIASRLFRNAEHIDLSDVPDFSTI